MIEPSPQQAWSLTEPVRKTIAPFLGLTAAAHLSIPQIPIFAEKASTDLMRLASARRLPIIAPPVFIYTNPASDAATPNTFLLQIALPIPADSINTTIDDRFAIVRFDAFECLAFGFRGSLHHIAQAYPLAVDALHQTGHTPIQQSREVYQHFIAYDSPQNLTEIQLGIG